MERQDKIPVKASEVIRRCGITTDQWRMVDDAKREEWREEARTQIRQEIKTTGATLAERVASMETRIVQLETSMNAFVNSLADLSSRLAQTMDKLDKLSESGRG